MLGHCTKTTRNNTSKDLCRQPWECFHTWTQESGSASERKLFQHEQTHCVHKLAPANLSVWNYFIQVVPLKETRLRVFTFADDVMLLKDSLTSGLTDKSERLIVQTMTDTFITVNYPKWTSLAKWLMDPGACPFQVASKQTHGWR